MQHVFVYGTLREGFHNHDYFLYGKPMVSQGTVEGSLLSLGNIPGYVPYPDGTVVGEVYLVDEDTLRRLDNLEGYREWDIPSSMYIRRTVTVSCLDGTVLHCFIYEWNGSHNYKQIKSGDFKQHVNERAIAY